MDEERELDKSSVSVYRERVKNSLLARRSAGALEPGADSAGW